MDKALEQQALLPFQHQRRPTSGVLVVRAVQVEIHHQRTKATLPVMAA
jgi:hypothetical protein